MERRAAVVSLNFEGVETDIEELCIDCDRRIESKEHRLQLRYGPCPVLDASDRNICGHVRIITNLDEYETAEFPVYLMIRRSAKGI